MTVVLEKVNNKYVCNISLPNAEIQVTNDVDSDSPHTATVNTWQIIPRRQPDKLTGYLMPPQYPHEHSGKSCGSCNAANNANANNNNNNIYPGQYDDDDVVSSRRMPTSAARISNTWRISLGNVYKKRQRSLLEVVAMNDRPQTCAQCEHLTRHWGITYWCGTSYIKRILTWLFVDLARGDLPREFIGCGCNLNIKWFMKSTPKAILYKLYLFGLKLCGEDTPDIELVRKANKKTECPLGLWSGTTRSTNPMVTAR